MTPANFWQKLSRRSQSNLYFALAFLPAERRNAFRDVYRFLRAADDVVDAPGLAPDESRRRLDTWRHELDAVYAGRATHPYARRLTDAVARYRLSREHFETILDALHADAEPRRFPSFAELRTWCEAMSTTLGYLCLQILEADSEVTRPYARDVGIALQLANILRDVSEDARRGHIYLPADELAAEGCLEADILLGRYTPAFARVAHRQAERARALVADARGHLIASDRRELLVPEIWADVYLALLDELRTAGYDVFTRRPYLRRRRKLALALGRWVSHTEERVSSALFPHTH